MPTVRYSTPESRALSQRLWRQLTRTEARVALLIGEGLSRPQVEVQLHISENTFWTHIEAIATKAGECGEAPVELSGISRVRWWVMRQQRREVEERLADVERQLVKANGTLAKSQGAVSR